jgi:2-keto-4-pentenoate hydratase/2-oxohepta-3-ene-1,7-dioic acid hydratase in catechol pathway
MKYARVDFAGSSYSGVYVLSRKVLLVPADGDSPLPAYPLSVEVDMLAAPVTPGKIIAIGKNYKKHAAEMGGEVPPEPLIFLKAPSSVIANGDPIILPKLSKEVHYEGELAVVIGEEAKNVSNKEALDFVFGYTILNDVTARDLQKSDGQWARAKSFDTFCPIGPWIETDFIPGEQRLITRVNGKIKQDCPLSDMAYSIARLISHASAAMTLLPGDVIATGTPSGVGELHAGDVVSVEIEGIGVLTNPVEKES